MWVSRRKWDNLLMRIKECEDNLRNQKENTEVLVRNTAKRTIEEPEKLLEEIKGIEDLERFVKDFIDS